MNINLIKKIHKTPYKFFCAITGGGISFIGDYCKISGASNNLIGAIVPYSQKVFDKFIGNIKIDNYASEEGARKLAVASYNECLAAGTDPIYTLGIGASSSIVKDNERADRKHKIHIAVHNRNFTYAYNGILNQGRNREQEEQIIVDLIFQALCQFTIKKMIVGPVLKDDEMQESFHVNGSPLTTLILNLGYKSVEMLDGYKHLYKEKDTLVFYSGSFNPVHLGHLTLMNLAEKIIGVKPIMELSLTGGEKGQLDFIAFNRITDGIKKYPYIVTNAPTYVQKSAILRQKYPDKKIIFIMGEDAYSNVWNEKFGYTHAELHENFKNYDIKFLVFGRKDVQRCPYGEAFRIKNEEAENLCMDFSSSSIRKQNDNT